MVPMHLPGLVSNDYLWYIMDVIDGQLPNVRGGELNKNLGLFTPCHNSPGVLTNWQSPLNLLETPLLLAILDFSRMRCTHSTSISGGSRRSVILHLRNKV